jgi:hypothetical protein
MGWSDASRVSSAVLGDSSIPIHLQIGVNADGRLLAAASNLSHLGGSLWSTLVHMMNQFKSRLFQVQRHFS